MKNLSKITLSILLALNLTACDSSDSDTETPVVETPTVDESVAAAKAFIADVRLWGNEIESELQSGADGFTQKLSMAGELASADIEPLISTLSDFTLALTEALDNSQDDNIDVQLTAQQISDVHPGATGTAKIVMNEAATAAEFIIDIAAGDNSVQTSLVIALSDLENLSAADMATFQLSISGLLENDKVKLAIVDDSAISLSANVSEGSNSANGLAFDNASVEFGLAFNTVIESKNSDDPVTFTGALEANVAMVQSAVNTDIEVALPTKIGISGSFNIGNEVFDAQLSIVSDAANEGNFVPYINTLELGYIKPALGSYTINTADTGAHFFLPDSDYQINYTNSGNCGDNAFEVASIYNAKHYSSEGIFCAASQSILQVANFIWNNNITTDNYEIDPEGEYQLILPAGETELSATGGNIDAKLVSLYENGYLETETSWVDITASLTLNANFTDAEETQITITVDRKGIEDGIVNVAFGYGERAITLETDTRDESGIFTITNALGDVMTLQTSSNSDNPDEIGQVVHDGVTIGTIRLADGAYIISYIDETVESLL